MVKISALWVVQVPISVVFKNAYYKHCIQNIILFIDYLI